MRGLAIVAALALPSAALAEPWHCDFTVECTAAGACNDTAHAVRIIAADHEGELFLTTATSANLVTRLTREDELPASYASAGFGGLAELLTVEEDGTALMTLHIFDGTAQAATYFGTCEVLQ